MRRFFSVLHFNRSCIIGGLTILFIQLGFNTFAQNPRLKHIDFDSLRNSEEFKKAREERGKEINKRAENYSKIVLSGQQDENDNVTSLIQTQNISISSHELSSLMDEKRALISFYELTGGDNWWENTSGWGADSVTNDWYGITVDENGHVIKMELADNHVGDVFTKPSIPEVFDDLPYLQVLNLGGNYLYNEVPQSLSSLSNLEELNLSSLSIEGSFDFSVFLDLKILILSGCGINFQFNSGIGSLSQLKVLDLSSINVIGEIPSEIGNLSNLEFLSLHGLSNNFCDGLPPTFQNLNNLKEFHFGWGLNLGECFDNQTLQYLPPNLEYLDLIYSGMTGQIPSEMGYLSRLEFLDMSYNDLSGEVPSTFNNLDNLNKLLIGNNQLEGDLPFDLKDSDSLEVLSFHANRFTFENFLPFIGNIPRIGYEMQDWVDEEKVHQPINGSSFSLTTSVDRNTDPLSKFQWFEYIDRNNSIPLTPNPTNDGHTYTFDSVDFNDNGLYYYTIVNDSAPRLTLRSYNQEISVLAISIDFDYYISECGVYFNPIIKNENNCEILGYKWDFGDSDTSIVKEPYHEYSSGGIYDVELSVEFDCNNGEGIQTGTIVKPVDLSEDPFDSVTLDVETNVIQNVLSASATTFSDAWRIGIDDETLAGKHPYASGEAGVWRNNGTYVYRTDRQATDPSPDISKEGTFTLETFNWADAEQEAIPGWLRTNNITQYSPYSYELENRDVLGNYSSAIYGYGGHMPVAVGQNMQYKEMAYTGFEELNSDGFAIEDTIGRNATGNWTITEGATAAISHEFEIESGYGNMAYIKRPIEDFDGIDTVTVEYKDRIQLGSVFINLGFLITFKTYKDVAILCKETAGEYDEHTKITLDRVIDDEYWYGNMWYNKAGDPGTVADINTTVAHTGTKSIAISSDKTIKQNDLQLQGGKEYLLSAWLSINDKHLVTPVLGSNLGIRVSYYDEDDVQLGDTLMVPQGNIIEGWQKLESKFTYPENASYIELMFTPGTATTLYIDDLRLHPFDGNMQSYVYELDTYRLRAVIDENNYASRYFYDAEGNLYLVKKETEKGIRTIQESVSYQIKNEGE